MAGVNKAIIIGNLGRDPELRYTQGGQPVCRLAVATSRKYKSKQGEMVEETEWHRITVWGTSAENCSTFLEKGRSVYVEGRLKTSNYEKDGQQHYSTEIVADTVQFLGGGGRGVQQGDGGYGQGGGGYQAPSGYGGSPAPQRRQEPAAAPYEDPYHPTDPGGDDIPF